MYKSPIEKPDEGAIKDVIDLCAHRVIDMLEDEVHKLMQHRGVVLDYDAFKDALKFDRNQYMKGYQDGIEYAKPNQIKADWIPTGCEEEEYSWVGECARCHEFVFYDNYCPNCGSKLIKPDRKECF